MRYALKTRDLEITPLKPHPIKLGRRPVNKYIWNRLLIDSRSARGIEVNYNVRCGLGISLDS